MDPFDAADALTLERNGLATELSDLRVELLHFFWR
jgi:hypothetical protein